MVIGSGVAEPGPRKADVHEENFAGDIGGECAEAFVGNGGVLAEPGPCKADVASNINLCGGCWEVLPDICRCGAVRLCGYCAKGFVDEAGGALVGAVAESGPRKADGEADLSEAAGTGVSMEMLGREVQSMMGNFARMGELTDGVAGMVGQVRALRGNMVSRSDFNSLIDRILRLESELTGDGIKPKIRALLRLRHLYPVTTMLNQYKAHVWVLTEYSNGDLILAAPCQLRHLDKLQRWYLHELGISDQDAFVNHNFAPPTLRRNIGLLGFLHKRVLGECHPALCQALPFGPADIVARYHTNHLETFSGLVNYQSRLYQRSLYAYTRVYNRLPQTLADAPSVSSFQARLTHLAKQRATNAHEDWRRCYQDCHELSKMSEDS